MKKPGWSILLIASASKSRVRRLPFSRTLVTIAVIFLVLGTLGACRCIYFAGSYGMAKLGMYYDLKENKQLKLKVQFLSKFTHEEKSRIDKFIAFEDKTRLKFGMDQISSDVRKVGVGGRPELNDMVLSAFEDPLIRQTDTIIDNIRTLLRQAKLEDTTFSAMTGAVDKQIDSWAQRPSVMPVWGRLTSTFGYRIHPFTGYSIFHEGLDISNAAGTQIHSTADGVVSYVGYRDYFGNVVTVIHPASGFKTLYAHLTKAAVAEGQAVKRGDLIGFLGNSGRSTGPHLHYEVHKLGTMVNPSDFILPTDTMVD
jgi:murein DD-endopeptidase MepM/ murein hydrolase activator NlpD